MRKAHQIGIVTFAFALFACSGTGLTSSEPGTSSAAESVKKGDDKGTDPGGKGEGGGSGDNGGKGDPAGKPGDGNGGGGDETGGACFSLTGPDGSCSDAVALKKWAVEKCGELENHILTDIKLGASCGNDGYLGATFTCCDQKTPPPPPPPPPPSSCFELEGPVYPPTCDDDAKLKDWAILKCTELPNHVLDDVTLGKSCGTGRSMGAKFRCCDEGKPIK
jgi:hypothetical protein